MLAIPWRLSEAIAWGLTGVHTALHLLERGTPPMALEPPDFATMRPETRTRLAALPPLWNQWSALKAALPRGLPRFADLDVIQPLGNAPRESSLGVWGRRNTALIAFENTALDREAIALLQRMDRVICHSRYNEIILREAGAPDVATLWQGIDPSEMTRPPRRRRWGDRFVVFSGGKLEFRKGQDIVLAAFRRFRQRHPEALLAAAWHNFWPISAASMAESPFVAAPPRVLDNSIQTAAWAEENGIPAESFVDLGFLDRSKIAEIMAESDVAVFPNRCEGGTNLVAMEALACAVPVVVAANSGQLDLLDWGTICWPLTRQRPLADPAGRRRGWGESDPDELVEAMERVHRADPEVRVRADRAREVMLARFTWRDFATAFVPACEG